jgi:predicted metal-dependent hydrolase
MASPAVPEPVPQRAVHARRIRFAYPQGSLERHFVEGDLVMSHVVAVLSAIFPPGEDFFVQSVRHFSDRVTDPLLKEQVKGFIGQEVTHGREHRELNDRLQAMGYPAHRVSAFVRWACCSLRAWAGAEDPLARLHRRAGALHGVIAEALLTKPEAQRLLGDTEVRNILLWHALEESEHKAVAFDVYRAVGGTERMRRWGFRIQSVGLLGLVGRGDGAVPARRPVDVQPGAAGAAACSGCGTPVPPARRAGASCATTRARASTPTTTTTTRCSSGGRPSSSGLTARSPTTCTDHPSSRKRTLSRWSSGT